MTLDPLYFYVGAYLGIACWFAGFAVGSLYEDGKFRYNPFSVWAMSILIGTIWPFVLFIGMRAKKKGN